MRTQWTHTALRRIGFALGIVISGCLLAASTAQAQVSARGAYHIKGASGKCLGFGQSDSSGFMVDLKPCNNSTVIRFFIAAGDYIFGDPYHNYYAGDPLNRDSYYYLFYSTQAGGNYRISFPNQASDLFRLVSSKPESQDGNKAIKIAKFGSSTNTCMTDAGGVVTASLCAEKIPGHIWTLVPTP